MDNAWISLGSNLGDRAATLLAGFEALRAIPGILEAVLSPCYETAPVGPLQPSYLNACGRLRIEGLSPRQLLDRLQAVEVRFGRMRAGRWGPRTLDMDLLLFGGQVLDEPGLTLPHPRLRERAFVLRPLADLDPALKPPGTSRTVRELLEALDGRGVTPTPWPAREARG
jgi:2-amino-4-hydroxy-6-hydroxymethyldihydropteridine diphosphokinase